MFGCPSGSRDGVHLLSPFVASCARIPLVETRPRHKTAARTAIIRIREACRFTSPAPSSGKTVGPIIGLKSGVCQRQRTLSRRRAQRWFKTAEDAEHAEILSEKRRAASSEIWDPARRALPARALDAIGPAARTPPSCCRKWRKMEKSVRGLNQSRALLLISRQSPRLVGSVFWRAPRALART